MEATLPLPAPRADDPLACARFFVSHPERFQHLAAEDFAEFRTTSWQALREARGRTAPQPGGARVYRVPRAIFELHCHPVLRPFGATPGDAA
jgi:hypothetical protein